MSGRGLLKEGIQTGSKDCIYSIGFRRDSTPTLGGLLSY